MLAMVISALLAGLVVAVGAWLYIRQVFLKPLRGLLASHGVDVKDVRYRDRVDVARRSLLDARRTAADAQVELERLRLAVHTVTQGIAVCDAQGEPTIRNSLATSTGSAHADALVDAEVEEMLALALAGSPTSRELSVYGPPAKVFFLVSDRLVIDDRVVGAMVLIDDVTEHERLDAMRRDFVANLSHELRTPIGAISLLAETVADETDPGTRERLNNRLVLESTRLANTIDDLLELSRIEHDDQSLREQLVMQRVVAEAVSRVRPIADTNGVAVGVVMPEDDLSITGDRLQLVAAVANLVENAVKYSEAGDSVSVRARVTDRGSLELAVQDTGIGIPQRDLDRVFERFYRVDRSRRSNTGGTGLGLAIVRHVVLNHGGAVDVESIEGEGSTFTMTFPSGIERARAAGDAESGAVDTGLPSPSTEAEVQDLTAPLDTEANSDV